MGIGNEMTLTSDYRSILTILFVHKPTKTGYSKQFAIVTQIYTHFAQINPNKLKQN